MVYSVRAVHRAVDLLDALADVREPQELGALARRVGLHPSTALRMLATLRSRRLVRESHGGWLLGTHTFELGSSFVRGNSIWSRGSALVERLALESEETSSLGILEHGDVLYIAIGHAQRELGSSPRRARVTLLMPRRLARSCWLRCRGRTPKSCFAQAPSPSSLRTPSRPFQRCAMSSRSCVEPGMRSTPRSVLSA